MGALWTFETVVTVYQSTDPRRLETLCIVLLKTSCPEPHQILKLITHCTQPFVEQLMQKIFSYKDGLFVFTVVLHKSKLNLIKMETIICLCHNKNQKHMHNQ